MTVTMVHPRFVEMMGAAFPSLATIQQITGTTQDEHGQEVETWADVAGMVGIPAIKAPLSAMERQAAGYTVTDRVWNVLLKGAYPAITTKHHVIIGGETFDIDGVETDPFGTLTRLRVRQVGV